MVWIIVSQFNVFELFSVSPETYALILVKVFMVSFGYLLVCRTGGRQQFLKPIVLNSQTNIIVQLILSMVLLLFLSRYGALIEQIPISEIRMATFQIGMLLRTGLEAAFFNYIVSTLVYFFLLLFVCQYLTTRRFGIPALLSLVNGVMFGLIGYGRFVYFDTAVFLAIGALLTAGPIGYGLHKMGIKAGHGRFKRFVVYSVLFFGILIAMGYSTAQRMGSSDLVLGLSVTFEHFVVYFLGPFRALDTYLHTFSQDIYFLMGRATFGGIDELIFNALNFLGGDTIPLNFIIGPITQDPIIIRHGEIPWFNAFYTNIMNFHLDFGVVGVVLFALMYGMVIAASYNLFRREPSGYTLMLVVFLTHSAIVSQLRWPFQAPGNWILLILIGIAIVRHQRKMRRKAFVGT